MKPTVILPALVLVLLDSSLVRAQGPEAPVTHNAPPAEEEIPVVGAAFLEWGVGFGTGHTLQGRWRERGWMFATADSVAFGFLTYAFATTDWCYLFCERTELDTDTKVALGIGIGIWTASRITSIVDIIVAGRAHNRRVRASHALAPFVAPTNGGTTAGVVIGF